MICKDCARGADFIEAERNLTGPAKALHQRCPGRTHCDCQHKVDLQAQGKAVQR